jgi:hypothetical protein
MRRMLITVIAMAIALPLCAAEADPTQRQRELIVELLELTSGGNTLKAVMTAMLEHSEKQLLGQAEARGDVPRDLEERKELYALLHEELAGIDLLAALAEPAIRIYAKHYTERELADLVAFYRTPTGRKSIAVMPQLVRESAEAASQHLGPILGAAASRAMHRQEEKRQPWKRTMADIRTISIALGAYASEREDLSYPPGDYESLGGVLVPGYLEELPAQDVWGTPYGYVASADGQHHRIVSAGADRKFEPDSLRIVVAEGESPKVTYRERLEDDIIQEDGVFVQLPAPMKPKTAGP